MEQFRFRSWQVYKDAKEFFSYLLTLTKEIPSEYRYELSNQITRAGFSIVLNIAEGSGKSTDGDLNRYIDNALGSVYEVLAAVDVLKDIGIITQKKFDEVEGQAVNIANQLGGFKKKIKNI